MGYNENIPIVDLHTHVLPGMDDGSTSRKASLEMLRCLSEQRVSTVCATSHYYARHEEIDQFLQRRQSAWEKLSEAMREQSHELPDVRLGAEVAYFPGIAECSNVDELCLSGTRTLLLELSFTEWTSRQVEEVASLSLDRGFRIILAHPERFCRMRSYWRDMERMLTLPIGLQINAESLVHWHSRKLALELLQSTKNPMLGSDCHNMSTRPPKLDRARQMVERKLGSAMLRQIDETSQIFTQTQEEETQEVHT